MDSIVSASAQALRLAVIHSLVTASGGDVHVRKGEQGGRVLRLTLPATAGIRLTPAV